MAAISLRHGKGIAAMGRSYGNCGGPIRDPRRRIAA